MSSRVPVGSSVIPIALTVAAAAAWGWQSAVLHSKPPATAVMAWTHVQEHYPMPAEPGDAQKLSPEVFEAIMAANPFSSVRRLKRPTDAAASEGGAPALTAAPAPQFVYKGLIKFGNRQRAILEDVTTHKTHFLEVGQEVAGFKVLDIAENRVVLSDPQTKEELVVSIASKASP
jgi:hypothetical protein